jgi:competence ComEA-like helix-hairpin-helix protein
MIFIRYWLKNFFGFSRSQVNAFVILLPLIVLLLFSEPLWHWWISTRPLDRQSDTEKLDSLIRIWDVRLPEKKGEIAAEKLNLVAFNPNTATMGNFVTLGFSQHLATRIVNYREKGGKFRIKSDLLKIYGVDSAFYQRVYPFIALPEREATKEKAGKKYEIKKPLIIAKAREKFDLNNADTSQLKKIYGIGDKLSLRIIKYRDVLGGFVDMDQLKEVYGLDSLVINRLIENSTIQNEFQPKKININTASEKQLSAHPYLSKVAKAIVSYRFQHGEFKAVEDIRNVSSLNEKTIQRIIPYLTVIDGL